MRFLRNSRVSRIHLLNRMTEDERPIHVLQSTAVSSSSFKSGDHVREGNLRNVESWVEGGLWGFRLLGLRVDGGQNGALGTGDLARDSALLFGTHLDRSRKMRRRLKWIA